MIILGILNGVSAYESDVQDIVFWEIILFVVACKDLQSCYFFNANWHVILSCPVEKGITLVMWVLLSYKEHRFSLQINQSSLTSLVTR